MVLTTNFNYESKKEQNQNLIGHSKTTSHTFLPNIEVVDDLVIVDYPGFEDTNGAVVTLGMECALKALIKEYQPKILLFEAITNTEGRSTALVKLSGRLERLFGNKEIAFLDSLSTQKSPIS